ncbi:hypothetical protein NST58_01675 [Paenibacillus sp. FSL R10-2796]|uniref:hypothetical protein n=1 Tax=Paenibacillus sp. FSL R10-2796 TaxID=2954663 RepID=UPI0030DB8A1F
MKEHFDDGEKVRLKETGVNVTIHRWSISSGPGKIQRYTYSIIERPSTFLFHDEIEKI